METVEAYGQWGFVAANVVFFLFFVVGFLAPKGWAEWRNMGATSDRCFSSPCSWGA